MHQATCQCGQLRLTCSQPIERTSICHCHACQRRTGSVFGVQARAPRAAVTVEGEATRYVRVGDAGGTITSSFCPTCGATVFWEIDALPDDVIVAVGAFADSGLPAPVFSVYGARMHPWVTLPDSATTRWD